MTTVKKSNKMNPLDMSIKKDDPLDMEFDAQKARSYTFGSEKFTDILKQIQEASVNGLAEICLEYKLCSAYKRELERRGFTISPKKLIIGYPTKTYVVWS